MQYTLRPEVFRQGKTVKDIIQKNYVKENMAQSRTDNPFTLIRRYSSKRHSSFLYYYMKLSRCHIDVSNCNHCRSWFKNLSHIYNQFFCKKNPSDVWKDLLNTPLLCDAWKTLFRGQNLSNLCLQKKWFYVILNDESLFKWILKKPLNLPNPVLDKSLD